jgi:membrane-associated phospholipid phosphatase
VRYEKLVWLTLLAAIFVGGYYAIGLSQDPEKAHTLLTRFDAALPFAPAWMFAYGGVYTALLLPIFIVKDARLFRRVALAYFFVLVVSFTCFLAYPVTTRGFRPDIATLDTRVFWEWGAALNYTLDPPMNSFPSLHVGTMTLATLVALKVDRMVGAFASVIAVVIALSTMLVKQHYVADVVAGAAVALAAYNLVVAPWERGSLTDEQVRQPRRWVVYYVLAYLIVILGVLLPLYLKGVKPWEKARDGSLAPVGSR